MCEVQGQQRISPGQLGVRHSPVQSARDHQVKDQPQIAGDADGDALADPAQPVTVRPSTDPIGGSTVRRMNGLARRTRTQLVARDPRPQCLQVGLDVRQLGQCPMPLVGDGP